MVVAFGRLVYLLTWVLNIRLCAGGSSERAAASPSDQDLLVHYLFHHKRYDALSRPVHKEDTIVNVQLGLAMIQIVQIDDKSQRLKSNVWLRMTWNDYRLAWNPEEFGGIDQIPVASRLVWKPDIVLLNNDDGKFEASWKPNIVLSNTGDVLWIPPAIYKSSCKIDVRYFPFDQQTCQMRLGSWTYNTEQVNLGFYRNRTNMDLSNYVTSGGWDIVDCPAFLISESADRRTISGLTSVSSNLAQDIRIGTISNRPRAMHMVFDIVLRRKPLFYITNLIIPCVLIALLSTCVFYLPTDAGEKITLSISILVTLVVFMLLVSKLLPPGPTTIPLLSQFLLFTFAMNFTTLFSTVVIINLNHRNPKRYPIPAWVSGWCTKSLPRFLCLQRPTSKGGYYVQSSVELDHILATYSDENGDYKSRSENDSFVKARCSYTQHDGAAITGIADKRTPTEIMKPCTEAICIMNSAVTGTAKDATDCMSRFSSAEYGRLVRCICKSTQLQRNGIHPLLEGRKKEYRSLCRTNYHKYEPSEGCSKCDLQDILAVSIDQSLRSVMTSVGYITKHVTSEHQDSQVHEDWKFVAAIIDRIQLLIFICGTIGGTLGILLNAPYMLLDIDQQSVIRKFSYED